MENKTTAELIDELQGWIPSNLHYLLAAILANDKAKDAEIDELTRRAEIAERALGAAEQLKDYFVCDLYGYSWYDEVTQITLNLQEEVNAFCYAISESEYDNLQSDGQKNEEGGVGDD